MDINLIRAIRSKVMDERLMLVYRGVVTQDNSIPLLMVLEKEMEDSEFSFVGRKRVFMFVLESLQNVSRHGQKDNSDRMSLVIYSKSNGGYTVATGNVVSKMEVPELRTRLDEINKLDNKQIRELYRQMLSTSEFNEKGGAGLGLVEMARSTGSRLDYDFVELNEDHAYFILTKTVDSTGTGIHHEERIRPFKGKAFTDIEKLMSDNNVYFIWSGHISPEVSKEVLTFTETKLSENDIEGKVRRRVFSIMVEILENVGKYSPGREEEEESGMPLAIIRFEDDNFMLTTGNLVLNSAIEELSNKLDTVNYYNGNGLKDLFIKSLAVQKTDTDSTGNMGLIDMARKSGSGLEYVFEPVDDDYSYFILTVRVENYPG